MKAKTLWLRVKEGLVVPVVIYASTDAVARGGEIALDAGAVAVTARIDVRTVDELVALHDEEP